SGASAWADAEGLRVEAVYGRLKTAYGLTFFAVPGEKTVLSLVLPAADDSAESVGRAFLAEVTAILKKLPETADAPLSALPLPDTLEAAAVTGDSSQGKNMPARIAGRPRGTMEARVADAVADLAESEVHLDTDFASLGLD